MRFHKLSIWYSFVIVTLISLVFRLLTVNFAVASGYVFFSNVLIPLVFLVTFTGLIQRHRYWIFLPLLIYYTDRMALFLQYNVAALNQVLDQTMFMANDWFVIVNSLRLILLFVLIISYIYIVVHERYQALSYFNIYALVLVIVHTIELLIARSVSQETIIYLYLPISISVSLLLYLLSHAKMITYLTNAVEYQEISSTVPSQSLKKPVPSSDYALEPEPQTDPTPSRSTSPPKAKPASSKPIKTQTVVCPKCGQNNRADNADCDNCGKSLRRSAKQQSVGKSKTCSNCQQTLSPQDTYCLHCGQSVRS